MSIDIKELSNKIRGLKPLDELRFQEVSSSVNFPPLWYTLIDFHSDPSLIRELWSSARTILPRTSECLFQHCNGVQLVEFYGDIGILYEMSSKSGNKYYYFGRPPLAPNLSEISGRLSKAWYAFSDEFRCFYVNIHNGWYNIPTKAMGPLPINDFSFLDEYEWGILEDLEDEGLDVELSEYLMMYSNGGGVYICANTGETGVRGDDAIVWYNDMEPILNENFWAQVDEFSSRDLKRMCSR